MLNVERILEDTYPNFKPGKNKKFVVKTLKKILHEEDFNNFFYKNSHLRGFAFLDKLLNYFKFSYSVSNKSVNNIPSEGRLIVVANHPIGTLDGLALLKLIRSVRPDVRVIANRVLNHMEPLQSLFISVPVLTKRESFKPAYDIIIEALNNEEAVIVFPAGEVSRISPKGVRDGLWQKGFLKLALKTQSPILPVHIEAKNSAVFYSLSTIYKPLGTFLLVNEMFNKKNQEIKFRVGPPIPYNAYSNVNEKNNLLAQRFRKHVLNLRKKKKKPLFDSIETVIHPANPKAIKKALNGSHLLGETRDQKKIFLYDYKADCLVMQEIARLRELTFRTVEEGTGFSSDLDRYDAFYRHIVLWDDHDLEIVGAYRIGEGDTILDEYGVSGFYTHSLFNLNSDFADYLPYSIELGRSFVQPRYWGQHSLDYLWYGIGAYLRERPHVKYLFGPVSLSNAYPKAAQELIIAFYDQQFGSEIPQLPAKQPFIVSERNRQFAQLKFAADYPTSFKILNSELKKLGVKVPTLYKQYVELCIDKGCHFIGFNIDPDFNNCIDSLIMVEIDKIAPKKKQRYIHTHLHS